LPTHDGHYILVGHQVVSCSDLMTWARWFETADRCVAYTEQDEVRVSTVFLGLDHNYRDEGPPVLFETIVFTGHDSWVDEQMERYSTWDEAVEGHRNMVAKIFKPTPILTLPTTEKSE
jgi:hypothetical protein